MQLKRHSKCSRAVFGKAFYVLLLRNDHFPRIFKEVKTKKNFGKLWAQYLKNFLSFSKIFLHIQGILTRLLAPKGWCPICLTSCQTISYLGSKEIKKNSRKSLKSLELTASPRLLIQKPNIISCDRKLRKIRCKTFQRNNHFATFCEFVYNILSMIVVNNFAFCNRTVTEL